MCTIHIFKKSAGTIIKISMNASDFDFYINNKPYIRRMWNKKYIRVWLESINKDLHTALLNPEKGLVVDHINRNPLDNRRENLRLATPSQNSANKSAKTSKKYSKHKGVTKSNESYRKSKLWIARIEWNNKKINGKRIRSSRTKRFDTEIEAAIQYNEWAKELYGDFAVLNKIE